MNKTRIEWTDYTWNPVTGCWGPGGTAEKPNRCPYCYAVGVAERFYVTPGDMVSQGDPFAPTFHPERLDQPSKVKKPSRIFVGSMTDLFGDWVPSQWILTVLEVADKNPHHVFQFLTKNPKRLSQWNGYWPPNCWVGTTVTNQFDADERLPELLKVDAAVRFVSHEPLLSKIYVEPFLYLTGASTAGPWYDCIGKKRYFGGSGIGGQMISSKPSGDISWAIIGAQTGPGAVKPEVDRVMDLEQQYRDAGVALFLKDNLGFKDQPQEFPA